MVFQSYALYPHMSVFDNMAFGLKLRGVPRDEIEARVKRAADMLGLDELLDRKPRALSGGQRQRVAMGRAIVREPQAFLMDEPLSNLDAKLRVQVRAEISSLQRRLSDDDDLRHARPGRGDDDGRARRRDAQGRAAAGRAAAGPVRPSGQRVRRRVHREPGDEPDRSERERARRRGRTRRARGAAGGRTPRSLRHCAHPEAARSSSGSVRSTSATRRTRRPLGFGSPDASWCASRWGPR